MAAKRSTGFAKIEPVEGSSRRADQATSKIIIHGQKKPIGMAQAVVCVLITILIYLFFRDAGFSVIASLAMCALFLALSIFLFVTVVFLESYERAVVQRYGKFNRVAGPGWTLILPFVEVYNVVDVRIKTLDLVGFEAITKDNIRLYLDIVVYAKIIDPYKAVLEVKDINNAIITFLKSITRETVGNLTAEEVISNIAKVNELLTGERDRLKKEWGVDLISVEIQEISLPGKVQESMHDLRSAEYQRQVVEQQAYARESLINAIGRAASKLDNPALAYMYLEAMKKIADGKATKLIFPMELTRLAESVSKHFGADKDKFLQDMLKAYNETVAKDMPKK